MESERHAFLRKLLKLCVDANVKPYPEEVFFAAETGPAWIVDVRIDLEGRSAVGYWDGERHEVWL